MMPRMIPGGIPRNMMPPVYGMPPRPMAPMPTGPSVGMLPMGPTIEVKKREDRQEPEKRVKRRRKKAAACSGQAMYRSYRASVAIFVE